MAVPSNFQAFKGYTLATLDAPEHTGGYEKMYGPFVVTGNGEVNGSNGLNDSTNGLVDGGIVVVGKGWAPDGVGLPDDFEWGILLRDNNRLILGSVLDNGANSISFTKANANVGSAVSNLKTALESGDKIALNASTYDVGSFYISEEIGAGYTNKGTVPGATGNHYIFTRVDSKVHIYEVKRDSDGEVTIKHHYSNAQHLNNTRLRVYSEHKDAVPATGTPNTPNYVPAKAEVDAKYYDELNGGGFFAEADTSSTAEEDDAASLTTYANSANPCTYLYLEDIKYDAAGDAYKSVSEAYPLKAVLDGEVVFDLKYWPNSPLSGKQPYTTRTIRIYSATEGADGFWVA